MAWYVYDIEFRRRASHNLSLNWGKRDVQLSLDTFNGLPNSGCRTCSSSDHHADSCPSLPLGQGTPQPGQTSATISTFVPVPAPHAPTSTDATSQDVAPPTLAWTTSNSSRTALNHLWALAIPLAATPE